MARERVRTIVGALVPDGVAALSRKKPDRPLGVVCLADCWMSCNAALRPHRAGVAVLRFAEGSDGWRDPGRALKPLAPYISRDRPSE